MTEKCETCRYWRRAHRLDNSAPGFEWVGACRVRAPRLPHKADEAGEMGIWPMTYVGAWCGEHEQQKSEGAP